MQTLIEHIQDWRTPEVEIDRAARTVRNVALTGLISRNGYRYAEQALRDAPALYDQKPVFLDHAPSLTRPRARSTRDLAGAIVNPHYRDGRIRGDVRLLATEAGTLFLALADSDSPAVGMSHVVQVERSPDGTVVERIHEVVSVDAVVFPATTTFREQDATLPPASTAAETGLYEPANPLADLIAERDSLQAELCEARRLSAARDEVERLLQESTLAPEFISPLFRQQLLLAPDTPARLALLQDRLSLLRTSPPPRPRPAPLSRERTSSAEPPSDLDHAMIQALKRHHGHRPKPRS